MRYHPCCVPFGRKQRPGIAVFRRKPRKNELVSVCPDEDGLAIARIKRDNGTPTLTFCTYQDVGAPEEKDAVLQRLVKRQGLDRSRCTSIMELGSYNLLLVEAPDVPPAELRAAMRWRVKDLIDFHVDDAVIDVFEVTESRAAGRNHLMYAVVARSALVKERIDDLIAAGLNLSVIDIPELAMRNIAALLPEDVGGVGFIYLVRGGGLITLTHQGRLYLSRLVDMARDATAAARATDAGDPDTQAWLDGIVIEVQRSMDYYESHFSQPPIANLVVAPLHQSVNNIEQYLSTQLGIPVRSLDLNSLVDSPEPLSDRLQFKCLLAVGGALRLEGKTL